MNVSYNLIHLLQIIGTKKEKEYLFFWALRPLNLIPKRMETTCNESNLMKKQLVFNPAFFIFLTEKVI